LWHSASLQAPLAFSGDRLIAKSPSGALVAIQARTGAVVWSSTQTFGDAPVIVADDTMVVVSTRNGNVDGVTPFFGLNAATGAMLWRNMTDTETGDGIDVFPGSIVVSYSAGEPHFSYVDIHDPRDERRLAQIQAVPHAESYFRRVDERRGVLSKWSASLSLRSRIAA